MKLLDWLFGINRDNAPLESDTPPVKVKEFGRDYMYYTRVSSIYYGLGGTRLDYAVWDKDEGVTRDRYWRRIRIQKECSVRWEKAPCEQDGFKYTKPEKFLEMLSLHTNQREHSVYKGKPTL